jgi:hypothetical protein
MSIVDRFRKLDQRNLLGLIGFILTVFSVFFAFYTFYYTKETKITFEITNQTNVLDILKPVNNLFITFQGDDIQKNNINLRSVTIKIENTGEQNILEADYDSRNIFGFKINKGEVIEAKLVGSNSEFLEQNINIQVVQPDTIKLEKIIFESNNYVLIEILVIHQKDNTPEIVPIGKIAGIDKMTVSSTSSVRPDKPFWVQTLEGPILVQISRAGFYLIAFILGFILFMYTLLFITGSIEKKERKKVFKVIEKTQLLSDNPNALTFLRELLFDEIENLHKMRSKAEIINFKEEVEAYLEFQESQDDDSELNMKRPLHWGMSQDELLDGLKTKGGTRRRKYILNELLTNKLVIIDETQNLTFHENFFKCLEIIVNMKGFKDNHKLI